MHLVNRLFRNITLSEDTIYSETVENSIPSAKSAGKEVKWVRHEAISHSSWETRNLILTALNSHGRILLKEFT